MKKYLLLLTFSLALFAQNPKSFAALGDLLYDDVDKFEHLKDMSSMQEFRVTIEAYIVSAAKTKKMGFIVDEEKAAKNQKSAIDGKEYLNALRQLSVEHDAIINDSRTRFKEALNDEDGLTINGMVDNGVIDPENYKDELLRYYEEFAEDQNLSSLDLMYNEHINSFKDDNATARANAQDAARENESRIQRMRAKDRAKSDALSKSVEDEKVREKKKVLNEQKKALGIN